MLVYVLNRFGKPLMPCRPQKARKLLQADKARVVCRTPFTIQLNYGTRGYTQKVTAGMDTGSKTMGCAAVANGRVIYQSEVQLRNDISKKMKRRSMYRRTRRSRKTRYRPARWFNRSASRRVGRLAPSIRSKVESHLREKRFIESILPVTRWKVETASFDIHKITNSEVSGKGYQEGPQKGWYNTKAYVLHRDGYKCRSGRKIKHSKKLNVHHLLPCSQGGSDASNNLLTLCMDCHDTLHRGEFTLPAKKSRTKHATEIGILKSQLIKRFEFDPTFGYETKYKREQVLNLPKSHANDAVAICCDEEDSVGLSPLLYLKRHVPSGDYRQTSGRHSEKKIPVKKLFGLRKFDLIKTKRGVGFIRGKRSSGYFDLMDIHNEKIIRSTSVRRNAIRITARTTTLIQMSGAESFRIS